MHLAVFEGDAGAPSKPSENLMMKSPIAAARIAGVFVMVTVLAASGPALADRIRWTVQAVAAQAERPFAWELEAKVARMTYGEMRLKAFAPGDLADPDETLRAVSIGAVSAAVLPQSFLPPDAWPPSTSTGTPTGPLRWLAGSGPERLRGWAAQQNMSLLPCGSKLGELSFLVVHVQEYRRLDAAQSAILDAACAETTLDGLVASDSPSD